MAHEFTQSGVTFKMDIASGRPYYKRVCLWSAADERQTIHMSVGQALDMVKVILDMVEELEGSRTVTAPF